MTAPVSLGTVPPRDLVDQRLQLHGAAHMVAWVARRLLPASDGPIRAALFWDARHGGTLAGASIGGLGSGQELRIALGFDPPAILLLEGADRAIRNRLALDGTTPSEAWEWMMEAVGRAGVNTSELVPLAMDQIPGHLLRAGGPFRIDAARAHELGRWFGLGAQVLTEQAESKAVDPSPPCWSHHFDMAVVVPLPGRDQAQVTLGFSPGDDTIPEPYLYVLAWPVLEDLGGLPDAPEPGHWERDDWTGLALPSSVLLEGREARDPIATARSFLERGFEVARSVALAG